MDLQSYINFTPSTAIYTEENELKYLTMGLISEVGELSGKVAKLFRGDKTIEGMKEKIAQEIGDIFWFLSQLHHLSEQIDMTLDYKKRLQGVYEYGWYEITTDEEKLEGLYSICRDLQFEAWHFLTDERVFEEDANSIVLDILGDCITALALLGYTAEETFDLNYEKLTGRKASGQLRGSGDDSTTRNND